jgi:hypothetical protein
MELRRKICTANDEKFRLKKEKIDSLLSNYDKQFNKKLHEFKMFASKQYAHDISAGGARLAQVVVNLLQALGFPLTTATLDNQAELGRILEDAINTVQDISSNRVGRDRCHGLAAARKHRQDGKGGRGRHRSPRSRRDGEHHRLQVQKEIGSDTGIH